MRFLLTGWAGRERVTLVLTSPDDSRESRSAAPPTDGRRKQLTDGEPAVVLGSRAFSCPAEGTAFSGADVPGFTNAAPAVAKPVPAAKRLAALVAELRGLCVGALFVGRDDVLAAVERAEVQP